MKSALLWKLVLVLVLAASVLALAAETVDVDSLVKKIAANYRPVKAELSQVAMLAPPSALTNPPAALAATTIARTDAKAYFNLGMRLGLGTMLAGSDDGELKKACQSSFVDAMVILKGLEAPSALIAEVKELNNAVTLGEVSVIKAKIGSTIEHVATFAKAKHGQDGLLNFGFGSWVAAMVMSTVLGELDPEITRVGKGFNGWLGSNLSANLGQVQRALIDINEFSEKKTITALEQKSLLKNLTAIANYYS